jgi:hypothetical protein
VEDESVVQQHEGRVHPVELSWPATGSRWSVQRLQRAERSTVRESRTSNATATADGPQVVAVTARWPAKVTK